MGQIETDIRLGDCAKLLTEFPDNTFDLIVTSPPYADSRTKKFKWVFRPISVSE